MFAGDKMNYYNAKALKFILFAAVLSAIVLIFSLKNLIGISDLYVKSFSEQIPLGNINIIIDPGHGGEDGGATVDGVMEKDLNLAISRNLSCFLKLSGYNSQMTREDDILLYNAGQESRKKYYDLENRVKFANNFENAVFLSIHQNKFEIPKYKGLQVYYSPNTPESSRFAQIIQSNAQRFLAPDNQRQIKKADNKIRVLDKLHIPAVLVECGFLSNYEEAQMLSDDDYQKKLAFMIFISTIQFLNENGENEFQ